MSFAVPRMWPGATVAVLATGPSLTQEQVDLCVAADCRLIAIHESYELLPENVWAGAILYGCDGDFWERNPEAYRFPGLKITLEKSAARDGVELMSHSGHTGFDGDPRHVRTGGSSGYQAACVAAHAGATRVLLLGFDCRADGRRKHWHGRQGVYPASRQPRETTFAEWRRSLKTLAPPLARLGVQVLNCTPDSAADAFPLVPLEEALAAP